MTYKEAKPFLKEGMTINLFKAGCYSPHHIGIGTVNRCCNAGGCIGDVNGHCIAYMGDKLEILTNPDGSPWVHPYESHPCLAGCELNNNHKGNCATTLKYTENEPDRWRGIPYKNILTDPFVPGIIASSNPFEFDNPSLSTVGWTNKFNEPKAQKENNKMNVIKMIKANLSPVDKQLVKAGYLTSKGERTSEYEDELKSVAIADLIEKQDTPAFRKQLAEALKDECND